MFVDCSNPTEVFLKVCGPILKDICFQSNIYAIQQGKILNLQLEELYAFIGINFLMGYNKLPSWRDYWSTSNDLGVEMVRDAMSRKRFENILSFLHVNDNSSMPASCKDRLYKLRPFISAINDRLPELYNVTREVSVDESMILFKGRSSIKQYNPMKPIKRGYKLWCLADQNGFISRFSVYQGKEEIVDDFIDYGLGERVVLSLTKPLWNKGIKVFFDNYFTSIHLLEKLKTENTFACGTIRSNRKNIPSLAEDKTLERGMYDLKTSQLGITVYKWRDNRIVYFASNFHGADESTVSRTEHDGSKKIIKCPLVTKDYNTFMGGVDKADQLRALYNVDRKSKKWWHRLFWGIIDIVFVNSFVINNELNNTKLTVKQYRRSVAQGLIVLNKSGQKRTFNVSPSTKKNCLQPRRGKQLYSIPSDVRLGNLGAHWIEYSNTRGRCEVCSKKKIESKPFSKCSTCKVFLCQNEKKPCFNEYHAK